VADQSGSGPYTVTSLIVPVNAGNVDPSSVKVYYSIDRGQNWLFAPMTATGNPNEYRGFIPDQGCGTVFWYYIYAQTTTGVEGTEPFRAPVKATHKFMTGQLTVDITDTYESNLGWTVGSPDDDATAGFWERVDPVGKSNPNTGEQVQPEDDHTPSPGVLCFVTDGRGGFYQNYDVDGGATSVVSPVYNWSQAAGAGMVEFWGFFANEGVVDDALRCQVSNDNGANWTDLVVISGRDANAWTYYKAYFADDDVPFTNQMRFRFRVADYNASLTEAAVDDVIIRHTVCSLVDVSDGAQVPARFAVEPNRPNPLRTDTAIRYALPSAGHVSVELFDAGGRLVRTVVDAEMQPGTHTALWDGRDDAGQPAASGVYYYRVSANGEQMTRKMLVVR
jgi:hypothetical protein